MGYFSAGKDDPNIGRKMLAGGATGAALGGLTGGLVAAGRGITPEDLNSRVDEAIGKGIAQGAESVRTRVTTDPAVAVGVVGSMNPQARGAVMSAIASTPEMVADILGKMSPESRKLVMKQFDKNWLTRMLGG